MADAAGVPLSQIHYHFGSKRQLILAVLGAETERLLERQREMFEAPEPLWVRWSAPAISSRPTSIPATSGSSRR